MGNGLYLVTGTSRGIGEALARKILEEGNTVLGVSRNEPTSLNFDEYHHLTLDLNDTSRISQIVDKSQSIIDGRSFDFLCLVNNASATEPVGPIEACAAPEIEAHVRIGLIAPLILTSLFMRRFAGARMRKKVAFISSGAAFRPIPGESVYCASKAGINMFAECVGLEQSDIEHGFEVISIGPGMVDTAMQLAIRSKSSEEFAMAGFFRQAFEDGRLQEPDNVARNIHALLVNVHEQGKYVNAFDA